MKRKEIVKYDNISNKKIELLDMSKLYVSNC